MTARRLTTVVVAVLASWSSACGYQDDNAEAARIVAQAYLRAYAEQDAGAVCRVLGPGQQQMFASRGGGVCEAGVEAGFTGSEPPPRAGGVAKTDDATAVVAVEQFPDQPITLLHLASTWRVVGGWKVM
jgi:hypothetical protein